MRNSANEKSLTPSQIRRRDWLFARLARLERKASRGPLPRQDRATYGRYLDEYETLTATPEVA